MAGEKILIVDDDLANAILCQRLLEKAGYQPQAVNDSKKALESLRSNPFDLLITDIRMPDMDGFELMTLAVQSNPDLAILLMTGFGTVENAVKALRFGADGLLLKPLSNGGELIDTVDSVLKKQQNKLDALRLKVIRPLFDISEHLYTETTLEVLSQLIVDDICTQTQSTISGIFVNDRKQSHWQLLAGKNITEFPSEHNFTRVEGSLTAIFDQGPAILITADDPLLQRMSDWMKKNHYRDMVCAPITRKKENLLFIAIRSEDQPEWRKPDLELITIFARQAAIAFENAQLYNDLKDFIRQLEDSQRSLIMAEKMAALGRLMGSLAHELNNPLQGVQNCLHLAARTDLPEEQRKEFIEIARKEVERVSALAQTTMEYYRPGSFVPYPVEMLGLVDGVLNLLDPQLKNYNIEVIRNYPDNPIIIPIIRDHVQQVILNLLLNAMDALSSKDEQRQIWIDISENDKEVEISVEDNGVGLAESVEERLFEPFVSTKSYGSGLGLSISYELIVEVHGGDLGFVSPLRGQGARVRVVLPRRD
ncbi:MAG: sensor histidine kinase [Bellilinea sp.]